MNYDMVKFERGQVWMVRFKRKESVGHEQDKDRPYLVLSVGRFNKSSGMVTMVPITSRDSIVSPAQVLFTNDRGLKNVIVCEQIRTFDYKSGAYIFDFMGNLSDEVLEKVDVAISIHLGLHYSPITLNKLYDSMEAIIKSVGYMQKKVDAPKFTDDDVIQFAEKLQMLASNPTNDLTQDPPKYPSILEVMDEAYGIHDEDNEISATKEIEVSTAEYIGPSIPEQDTIKSVEVKTKRIRWTPETCKEFLKDADTLPMKDVMIKWDILKKTRFYYMRSYASNLLKQIEE